MSINESDDLNAEIQRAMAQWQVSSIDEANAVLAEISNRRNHEPLKDFCGLSPAHMMAFIHNPFDSADIIEFPVQLENEPSGARIAVIFLLLAAEIGEAGVKTTVKGNLPRKVVRAIAEAEMSPEHFAEYVRYMPLQSETNYKNLNITRIVAQQAGLIRKVKGTFTLTKICQKMLAKDGMRSIYPRLLRTYVEKYNWQYRDLYSRFVFLQRGFAYTLYLLDKFGADWRPPSFYGDAFLTAFPQVLEDVPDFGYFPADEQFNSCFSYRCLTNFAEFFGLVETTPNESRLFSLLTGVRKTSLLADAVRFHIRPTREPVRRDRRRGRKLFV